MKGNKGMITVYYDGACPQCVKDRHQYEKLSGNAGMTAGFLNKCGHLLYECYNRLYQPLRMSEHIFEKQYKVEKKNPAI